VREAHGDSRSDRAKVYNNWPGERQLCWAHIKRNWEKWIERGGDGAHLGREWLELHRLVFELWHRYRMGTCAFREFDDGIAALMMATWDLLARGQQSANKKFAGFCERLAKQQASLWTFAVEPGVEPTNNTAERILRRAVLWRRRSFGCNSADGCRSSNASSPQSRRSNFKSARSSTSFKAQSKHIASDYLIPN